MSRRDEWGIHGISRGTKWARGRNHPFLTRWTASPRNSWAFEWPDLAPRPLNRVDAVSYNLGRGIIDTCFPSLL